MTTLAYEKTVLNTVPDWRAIRAWELAEEAEWDTIRTEKPIDFDLLNDILALAMAEPLLHDQGSWMKPIARRVWREMADRLHEELPGIPVEVDCGSAGCIAGWAVALRGGVFEFWGGMVQTARIDGQSREIPMAAQELLGLDRWSANILFAADNSIDDLQDMVWWLERYGTLEEFDRRAHRTSRDGYDPDYDDRPPRRR